jgi:hypothetical protein
MTLTQVRECPGKQGLLPPILSYHAFLISLFLQHRCSKASQSSVINLSNAPTSLCDDIITYKSFVQRKRSSEAPCSSAATAAAAAAPCFFSALNPVFCWVPLQGVAGGAHHHELFCPGSGASRTVAGFLSSTNWGDSLCTIVHRACCPVHVKVGPFCLTMITFKYLVGGWSHTNYIIFRNAEKKLFK